MEFLQIVSDEGLGEAVRCRAARGSGLVVINGEFLMTSQRKIESNIANSRRSTGPVSELGKRRSSQNARKYGMRSDRETIMMEDAYSYEERRRKWMARADPRDDMEEYFIAKQVGLSFQLDAVQDARFERITSEIEDADTKELDDVEALGDRLLFDSCGPTPLYGNKPDIFSEVRTSSSGMAVDPNKPATLVKSLCASAQGCRWMLERWEALRERLVTPGLYWQGHDRLCAIRLIGRQPVEAASDKRVCEIFVCSAALGPNPHEPFQDLLSDMTKPELDCFVKRIMTRWTDLVSVSDKGTCRRILIDLVDRNVEILNAKLEVHEENAETTARKLVTRVKHDRSPAGVQDRSYEVRCLSALYRGNDAYQKMRRKKLKGGGGSAGDSGLAISDSGLDRTNGKANAAFAERKTAIWELAEASLSDLSAYLPPSRHD